MPVDETGRERFSVTLRAPRIVFGERVAATELSAELDALKAARVLVLGSEREQRRNADLLSSLGTLVVGRFTGVRRHVPRAVAEESTELAKELRADCLLSIGGGSAVGTAKAIALETQLPIVAIPTTYAGSEVTPVYGITDESTKRTGRSDLVLPKTVLIDPTLTWDLPAELTRYSAVNALAHCVSGVFAPGRSPVTDALAVEGAVRLARGLRGLHTSGENASARSDLALGAYLAGTVLAHAGTSAHHTVCHILGGAFDLPHAETHTAVLPASSRFLEDREPGLAAQLATTLGGNTLADAIRDLLEAVAGEVHLRDIGLDRGDLPKARDLLSGEIGEHGVPGLTPAKATDLLNEVW